jgi:serine protease Do
VSPASLPLARAGTLSRWLVVEKTEPDSPAAKAGLRAGDIILQVADLQVASTLDLERAFLDRSAGDTLNVVVRRQAALEHCQLVLQALERPNPSTAELIWRKLGLRLAPVNPEIVTRQNRQLRGGMAVVDVNPSAAAAKAGIQRGDILVGLHQWETVSLDNVAFVLTHPELPNFSPVRFFIVRGGQVHRGWLQQVE